MAVDGDPPANSGPSLGPIAKFAIKTLIVAGAAVMALTLVTEMALSGLDDVLRRNTETTLTRVDALIRNNTQAITADIRSGAQAAAAEIRLATSGSQSLARLERALEWAADPSTELTSERRAKLISNIRTVSDRWRPILLEAQMLFAGPGEPVVK